MCSIPLPERFVNGFFRLLGCIPNPVCHPDQGKAAWRDLRTESLPSSIDSGKIPRFRFAPLGMTSFFCFCGWNPMTLHPSKIKDFCHLLLKEKAWAYGSRKKKGGSRASPTIAYEIPYSTLPLTLRMMVISRTPGRFRIWLMTSISFSPRRISATTSVICALMVLFFSW